MRKKNLTIVLLLLWLIFPSFVFAQTKVTTFRLWSWLPSYEKQYFDLAVDRFNKENPQTPVAITYENVPFDDLHSRIIKNLGDDAGLPDILAIEFRQWPTYEADGPGKYLIDLSDLYHQAASQLFDNTRYEYVYHRKHFALCWQSAPLIFVYQKSELDKEGVSYPLKTWSAFRKAAVKVHEEGKTLALMEVTDPQVFYSLFLQHGGTVYNANGDFVFPKYVGQAEDVLRLLKYLHDKAGFGKEKVNDFIDGKYNKQFVRHDITGLVAGDWLLLIIKKQFATQKGEWRIQAAPVWSSGGYLGTSIGGTGYALVQKKSRSPEKLDLLANFLSFATTSFEMQTMYFRKWNLEMTNKILFSRLYAMMYADSYLGGQKTMSALSGEMTNMAPRYTSPGLNDFFERLMTIQKKYIDGKLSLAEVIRELSKKPV